MLLTSEGENKMEEIKNEILNQTHEQNSNTNLYNSVKIKHIKQDKDNPFVLYLLWAIAIIGFFIGVIYIFHDREKSLDFINDWFEKTLQQKSNEKFLNLFLTNINSILTYMLIIFSLGFSPILSLIINLIPFIKGVGMGLNVSYVYVNYGWRGIVYESLIDIPIKLILMIMIILFAKEAIKFSNQIRSLIVNRPSVCINLKKYCVKFIFAFVVMLILCLLNTFLDFCFFNYFNIL